MSSKDNLALDLEHGVRRWDRARWISVFSSHNPTIREVTECLGLGLSASSSTTNRGIPKFDNPDYRKLSSEVTKLSKELPKERDALLDFAADPHSLDRELDQLLATYGPAIWGTDADRSCLLKHEPSKKTYNQDLYYENPEHREILRIHLHRWIVIKACYYIRNMKLKRPSGANDYDTLADIDGEHLSPHGTPHSHTPSEHDVSASLDLEVKPINGRKRKSEAFGSLSDGEQHSSNPAKRAYSTMPINRGSKSPRKSLHNLLPGTRGSSENIPPLPSHKHHLSPSPSNGADHTRIQLSPLSNNELNGVARPSSVPTTSAPGGFTPVNSGGFTPVNNGQNGQEPPATLAREPSRGSPREAQQPPSPSQHRDGRSYTSPYDTASHSGPRPAADAHPAPPIHPGPAGAPTMGEFKAVNTHATTNGRSSHNSPATQPAQHAHIAPQPQQEPHPQPIHPGPAPAHSYPPPHAQTHPSNPPPHSQAYQQPPPGSRSRGNTPGSHQYGRSLAPHPSSRSNTPHASTAYPPPPPAAPKQAAPAPPQPVQTAHTYGMTIVPATYPESQPPRNHPAPPAPHHAPAQQSVLKSQPVEVYPPQVARPVVVPPEQLRQLQYEVTTMLLQYLYPRQPPAADEATFFQHLHSLWYHGDAFFRTELGSHYDTASHVLLAWMQERATITALQQSLAAAPGVPSSSTALIDRILLMNDLRAMRLKWKNMSNIDGVSPEDLLVESFCAMTITENTEFIFKEGLARLERGVFDFLRNEDSKIVMHRR